MSPIIRTIAAAAAATRKKRRDELEQQLANARQRLLALEPRASTEPRADERLVREAQDDVARLERELRDFR